MTTCKPIIMFTKLFVLSLSALLVTGHLPQAYSINSETALTGRSDVQWKCTHAGLMCTDCKTLSLCVNTGGEFQTDTVKSCTGAMHCSQSTLSCSSKMSGCSNSYTFTCHTEGRFPDPYECNVYYECGHSTSQDYVYDKREVCPPEAAYDAATGECSLSVHNDICVNYPIPLCTSDFSAGAVPANANLYYICVDSKPQIYKCPSGESFNAQSMSCETSTFHCPGIGTFADPKDCHKYYTCKDVQSYTHHSCFIGFYFDAKKKRCILGIC